MKKSKKLGLTTQILIAMALGFFAGLLLNQFSTVGDFVDTYVTNGILSLGGKLFIASLKLLVVPLVLVSIVCGAASLDDVKKLGRVGAKTFGLYIFTTACAITLAILLAAVFGPGVGFNLESGASFQAQEAPPFIETLVNMFPSNPFAALAKGEMLQVIVFALLFGFAMVFSGEPGKRILRIFQDLNEVIMKLVMMIMQIAPYGVFCLIAKVFSDQGFSAILPLGKYFLVVLLALLLHVLVIYVGLIRFIANLSVKKFWQKFKSVPLFAFSTSSSGATIPVSLEVAEHKLGIDNSIAAFTIPLGATINMDGTAIMQGVATVFIAQAYGVHLELTQYLMVIVTATLASIGTAAVPGVGLITLAMVLRQVGLPVEGIGLIIGVDRLLDMTRTAVNVTGDAVVSLVVAKMEGGFSPAIFNRNND